jgi:hypothetical protein
MKFEYYSELFCRRRVVVLMYHGIGASGLEVADRKAVAENCIRWQLEWLREGFRIIGLEQA